VAKVLESSIERFRPEHAPAFAELNRRWLVDHGLLEPADEPQLADPWRHIIEPGGQIFVALQGDAVIGTAALLPHGEDVELAKLVVTPSHQGRGLGRRLALRCLEEAAGRGARRMVLVSNSRLQTALRLYEALGFQYRPVPATTEYATADVYMELELGRGCS
jgi:GNAT superfamily N-acetyltransferase